MNINLQNDLNFKAEVEGEKVIQQEEERVRPPGMKVDDIKLKLILNVSVCFSAEAVKPPEVSCLFKS